MKPQRKCAFYLFVPIAVLAIFTLLTPPSRALDAEYEKNGEVYMLIGGTNPDLRGVYNLNNKDSLKGIEFLYDPGLAYGINVDRGRVIYTYNVSTNSDTNWTMVSGNIEVAGVSRLGTQSGTHHYAHDTGSKCVGCTVQGLHSIRGNVLTMPNGYWYHMSADNRARKITRHKWDQLYDLLSWGVNSKLIGAEPDISRQRIAVKSKAKEAYLDINCCHDGCGPYTGSGSLPTVEPITDITINGKGDAYFYKRTAGKADGAVEKNGQAYSGGVIGSLNDPTSKFIAISTGAANDYVYVLGNNVIKEWLVNANFGSSNPGFNLNSLDITDIVVSDQWWSSGGIVYAFDKPSNNVYKFVRNEATSKYDVEAISIDNTDGDVDSIATDGFGSLYYVKTYMDPATPANFNPRAYTSLSWTNKDLPGGYALGYADYSQKVSKGVFKLDIFGGAPKCIGEKIVGYNKFRRYIEVRPYTGAEDLTDPALWDDKPYTLQGDSIAVSAPVEIASINFGTPPEVAGYLPGHVDIAGPFRIGGDDNPFDAYAVSEWTGFEENEFYMFIAENFPLTNTYGLNIRSKDLENESSTMVCDSIGESTGVLSKNTLGWTGGLPTSIDMTSVRYKWEIFQVRDRFGNDKDADGNQLRRQVWPPPGDSSVPLWCEAPVMGIFFDGGEYDICLSIRYNWWDYRELPFGASVNDRDSCYKTGQMCIAGNSGGTTSKMRIKVKPKTVNELTDSGQIVLKVWVTDQNGNSQWVQKTPVHSTSGNNQVNYFVVDQGAKCRWEMIEKSGVSAVNDRTTLLTAMIPPFPPEGTRYDNLKWDQDMVLKWKFELPEPRTPNPDDTLISIPNIMFRDDPANPFVLDTPLSNVERAAMGWSNDLNGLRQNPKILSIPSDPYMYTVYANAYRGYSYDMFAKINLKDTTGRVIMDKMVKLPYKRLIQLEAMAYVLVRDTEPPKIFTGTAPSLTPISLKGTTGDTLSAPSDGTANPQVLSVIFEDNNPFGNDNIICTIPGAGAASRHNLNNMAGGFSYETCYEVTGPDSSNAAADYYTEHRVTPRIVTIPNLSTMAEADDDTIGQALTEPRKLAPGVGGSFHTAAAGMYRWNKKDQFYRYAKFMDATKDINPVLAIETLTGGTAPAESEGANIFRSYFRVSIPLEDLDEFSPQGAALPTYYAVNRDNYRPLTFSFRATDSSNNAAGLETVGTIDIKDSHKPYITLQIQDARKPEPLVSLPQKLTAGTPRNPYESWHFIDDNDWVPDENTGVLATPFPEIVSHPLPLRVKAATATELFGTDDPANPTNSRNLEEDLRYQASLRVVDNIPNYLIDDSDPAKKVPNLKNQIATQLTSSSGFEWSRSDGLGHTSDSNHLIFRKRGDYWIEFQIRDQVECGLDNSDPASPKPLFPASIDFGSSSDYHLRTIRYYLDVEDTRISVHTIGR